MPSRRDIFINGGIYHIFNKTLDKIYIFKEEKICRLFQDTVSYYRSQKADLRLSHFRELPEDIRKSKEQILKLRKHFKIDILGYCLMPNHFHLILKQLADGGIIRFMSDVLNSLTRYYNSLNKRKGPVFLTQFKSNMIKSNEQLKHTSRYKHLNPYSSGLIKTYEELERYPWSSFGEYLGLIEKPISNIKVIMNEFGHDRLRYKKFVLDNAEYQKTLEYVKHLEKWA